MRQAQAGFGQLIASPKRRKIVHLLSEKNSEIQPKQKLWVSDHLASWHCIQAWPNLQKHPSWGKKIHSQLQWLAPWDDIPNSCLQIPNQSNHLQSHRPGNFGADEVGISESKLWEFICLIPQRYSLTTRCKQKICWLQFAPKKSRKMPEVRRFSNNQVAGSILKEILNHLYVADFQAWSWDVFFTSRRPMPCAAPCNSPWRSRILPGRYFCGEKNQSMSTLSATKSQYISRNAEGHMCLDCKILSFSNAIAVYIAMPNHLLDQHPTP